jgi:four helix bundle protein
MAPIFRFEDIEGWQKSRALQQAFSQAVASSGFKKAALQDQLWRCTDSAMSNISEGFDSGSNPEFVRFLNISFRSLTEFQSHLYTSKDEGLLSQRQLDTLYGMAREARSRWVASFVS